MGTSHLPVDRICDADVMGRYGGVELDDLELDGARLRLRPWASADVPRLVEALSGAQVHQFIALPDPYTAADAEFYVSRIARQARADGTALECAVVERSSGRAVGSAALRFDGDAEIGYWIAPDAQGARYATEATTVLTDWAFSVGLPRVRLACDVRNLASVRTALAAGYRFEGVARAAITSPGGGTVPPRRGELARFARLPGDPDGPLPHSYPTLSPAGLSDGVLCLRPVRESDAAALVEADDDVAVGWGFFGTALPVEEVRRRAAAAGLQWLVGGAAVFAMVDVESGLLAGSITLRNPGPPQIAGIGYGVHPTFRGRGYTTRALRLLVAWAFDVCDLARLELGAKVGNDASMRAAERAGFSPDGVRARRLRNPDGTFSDEVRYALINPKYA
jgi:RimJ/RimL family protein N-acetyltransferase